MSTSETALVTGGAGFIGSHLVRRLVEDGFRVIVLDNFSTGRRENLEPVIEEIELVPGEVQSYERVAKAIGGCDLVFHLAADPSVPRSIEDPIANLGVNVTGTLNVLLAARDADVRRVVYASSTAVYGSDPRIPKREDMRPAPMVPYAVNKLAGEGYCRSFSEVYGLDSVALRYFNIFGPRQDPTSQYAAALASFIDSFLSDRSPTIYGDGEQTRDFCHVDNVVDANLKAAGADRALGGEAINIGCGEQTSVNQVVDMLRELTGSDRDPIYADARPGDILHSAADISRAEELVGYEARVDLFEGLRDTLEAQKESHAGAF